MLAVGSDDPGQNSGSKVRVYELNESHRRWERVESLTSVKDAVHDLAFAPDVGRSYALLAVATSSDLRVITLKPVYPAAAMFPGEAAAQEDVSKRYEVGEISLLRFCRSLPTYLEKSLVSVVI